ncbi:Fad-dependent urate hydroxylase [Thalictrum thalictroides]|uniref:Fad-dependent urate hydroxylase n=1 Tax=Thalictrum thalictroides TaxID=46969 RepID=A0A7J6V1H2_THATH|nr:Fad-dependent urate hydroxylase [Thalictrum thalictroides]
MGHGSWVTFTSSISVQNTPPITRDCISFWYLEDIARLGGSLLMETVEDIVIVGAGIAGLTTALGLHRLGLRSLVLESSKGLRVTGFALATWTNAWKALDAIGVGDTLRENHLQLKGIIAYSAISGLPTSKVSFEVKGRHGDHEIRCVRRQDLLEALARELPDGTIRFSSKVVSIDETNYFKLVHLADGSTIKTKVLIGCDGINSVVAKWLGLSKPKFTGRLGIRGLAKFPDGHNFEQKVLQFFGDGFRSGFVPCDQNTMYWFFAYTPFALRAPIKNDDLNEEDPSKLKQFVLQNLGNVPKEIVGVVEQTNLDSIVSAPLKFRSLLNVLWPGAIYKGNVCVAGDALHPMTPDIGQGGCAALEDGIVLARHLSQAFLRQQTEKRVTEEKEYIGIKKGLKKFAEERKWRSFELMATSYMVGRMQQSSGKIINFFRDKVLPSFLAGLLLKRADFDCGNLISSQSY